MSLAARVRRALARSPWLYWAMIAVLAGVAGLLVARSAARVESARAAWGEARPVAIAVTDVEAGDPLAAMIERRDLPSPMIPPGAVESVTAGAVARQRISAGEIVVAHDVDATGSPQALIPEGWLAVAVAEPVPSGASTGDQVAVGSGGIVLAVDGLVVGATDSAILVAVPAADAAQVAHAAGTGDLAVLLKP